MAVMPKVSQEALDYIESFGISTDTIIEDGVDRDGYYPMPDIAHWPGEFIRWPEGFDYDHLVSIQYEKPKKVAADIKAMTDEENFALLVNEETSAIASMLIEKNKAYGNSALDPVRIFSGASPEEQLLVRIDDKLSRLQRGTDYADEDTVTDLIGYLILLKIARK